MTALIKQYAHIYWNDYNIYKHIAMLFFYSENNRTQVKKSFVFQEKLPKTITLLSGENLTLHCSAVGHLR